MYYLIELVLAVGLNNYSLYDTNIRIFANIIKYSRRPFQNSTESMLIELAYKGIIPLSELSVSSESLELMDNQIIKSINSTVKKEDHLVIIGDFCFAGSQYKEKIVEKYTSQINCKNTILILGNHDDKKIMLKHFQQVHDYFVFNVCGKNIITSHYPMRTWYKQSKNSSQPREFTAQSHNIIPRRVFFFISFSFFGLSLEPAIYVHHAAAIRALVERRASW